MSDDGEVERDSLHIKPPQAQAGNVRREKSHKHKHKTERRREKQRPRDRESKLFTSDAACLLSCCLNSF